MRWALLSHPGQYIRGRLVQAPRNIPEASIPIARSQGWIVIAQDTGIYGNRVLKALQPVDVPAQSNPRRYTDDVGGD